MFKVLLMLCALGAVLLAQETDVLFWSTKTPAPTPGRCQIQAHGNVRDTIYICGGRTASAIVTRIVQAYVPGTNSWVSTLPSMPGPRSHGCGDVIDSIIYAAGGFDSSGAVQATLYAFYVNSKTWATLAPMPSPGILCAGAAYGGRFYVFGKQNNSDTLFEYVPGTNTWNTRVPATRPQGRRAAAAAGTANYFYVMGGLNAAGTALQDCWRFTRMTGGAWTQMADMPGSRVMHAAYTAVGDSVIYVVGGNPTNMGAACDSIVYKYSIALNIWTTETPMPTSRGFLTLDRAQDKIYAICGINGAVYYTTNEEGGPVVGGIEENQNKTGRIALTVQPNPINRYCSITYYLDKKAAVSLEVYNSCGELIEKLVNKSQDCGIHAVKFDRYQLPDGAYFVRLTVDNASAGCKLLMIR